MGLKLQIIIAVIVCLGIAYIINLIRKNRLELKYALSWLIVAAIVLVLNCFPNLMVILAEALGIASPVNMMFFVGFLFSLVIILTLTITVSAAQVRVKRLNQKIALLEKRIGELEKKDKENHEKESNN